MSNAWGDYLKARWALIHEWNKEGIPGFTGRPTPELIARELNHVDPGEVRLLISTPLEPEPVKMVDVERKHILDVYRKTRHATKAAKLLGISRAKLYRRLKSYGVEL